MECIKNFNNTKFENMLNFKYFQDFFPVMTGSNHSNMLIQQNFNNNNVHLNDFTICFILHIFSQNHHMIHDDDNDHDHDSDIILHN